MLACVARRISVRPHYRSLTLFDFAAIFCDLFPRSVLCLRAPEKRNYVPSLRIRVVIRQTSAKSDVTWRNATWRHACAWLYRMEGLAYLPLDHYTKIKCLLVEISNSDTLAQTKQNMYSEGQTASRMSKTLCRYTDSNDMNQIQNNHRHPTSSP